MKPEYLGDGVYAEFDGYHIWLHANSYPSATQIALEPYTFQNLLKYAKQLKEFSDES